MNVENSIVFFRHGVVSREEHWHKGSKREQHICVMSFHERNKEMLCDELYIVSKLALGLQSIDLCLDFAFSLDRKKVATAR